MNRKIIALVLLFCLVFTCGAEAAKKRRRTSSSSSAKTSQPDSVLPKRGDIAVIVEGDDEQHVKIAETKIIDSLTQHGYRVVDEKKMRAARKAAVRAQAYRLAMQGNYNAIFRLSEGHYSCAATVIARVQAGKAVQNQFGLFTGTASVSLIAVTSRGTKLGGKTANAKEVGISDYEALMKCIESSVENGMKQLY